MTIIFIVWIWRKNRLKLAYSKTEKYIVFGAIVWIASKYFFIQGEITKTTINFYAYEHIIKPNKKSHSDTLTLLSMSFWFFDYLAPFILIGWLFLIPASW